MERGLHGIYDHMTYDFIYPDIYNVLRFLDNHDTDRFLKEYPQDLSGWKQASPSCSPCPVRRRYTTAQSC